MHGSKNDLQYLWLDVTKIIDELHIKNHTDKRCIEKYNHKEVLSKDMAVASRPAGSVLAGPVFMASWEWKWLLCATFKLRHMLS